MCRPSIVAAAAEVNRSSRHTFADIFEFLRSSNPAPVRQDRHCRHAGDRELSFQVYRFAHLVCLEAPSSAPPA